MIFILLPVFVLLLGWVGYLHYHFYKIRRASRALLKQARGSNLEEILNSQNRHIKRNTQEIDALQEFTCQLEKRLGFVVQKVKVIRYDAFAGEGGEQSFSVALLDQHQNGMVLSKIHSREGDHIYAKPVFKGISPYHLTKEEREVISADQVAFLEKTKK